MCKGAKQRGRDDVAHPVQPVACIHLVDHLEPGIGVQTLCRGTDKFAVQFTKKLRNRCFVTTDFLHQFGLELDHRDISFVCLLAQLVDTFFQPAGRANGCVSLGFDLVFDILLGDCVGDACCCDRVLRFN